MRKFIILILALIASPFLIAQKKIPGFGEIDIAELKLPSCSFEPDANAMKIFDVQEIEFDPGDFGSKLVTERRVRVKVFNEKGYKYASVTIPYFSKKRSTKIKDLEGVVYNLDSAGRIVIEKLEKKDFFKENAQDNIGVINFTFPNLRPGSIVEFRYRKVEKNIIQIDPWIAQDEIPTAYASTILITPSYSRVREKILGADTLEQKTERLKKGSYTRVKRTYYRDSIHSFQPEPFMSSYKDNLLKVIFMLIPEANFFTDFLSASESVWKFAGNMLMNSPNFGGQIKKPIPGTEKLIDSAKSISSIADRISFIYENVKKRILYKAEQTLYPDDLAEAWNTQSGNTAEINLILLNLLQKSDVQSYPILVSTRENGKVNMQFPSIGQLNGVDVLATDSNKVYILDASLKFQSSQNPPFNILNRNAYLLNRENMRWVLIDDDRPLLKQSINVQAMINESGIIEGNAFSWHFDYAKSYMLDTTIDDDEDNKFQDKIPTGLKILSVSQENADNNSKPLEQKTEFTYEPPGTGDFYFINPQFLSSKKENPFVKDSRHTDIDFGCNQEIKLNLTLSFPATFEVDHLPKGIIVRAPDSSFLFRRYSFSDSMGITIQQIFEIKQPVFYRDVYPGIQEFFERVYALMSEEIVLKRKK